MKQAIRAVHMTVGVVLCLLAALSYVPAAQAAGEYEPNDTREAAYGPLAGGTDYTATFETDNDVDWYVFYIKTYSQMDFSATHVKENTQDNCYAGIELLDKDGKEIDSFSPGPVNQVFHLRLTMNPGRYYLAVGGCTGDRYRFRIDPAASITTSRECGEAIVAKDAVAPLLATVNEDLAKNGEALATTAQAVHEAKRQLRRASKKAQRLKKRLKQIKQPGKRRRVRSKLRQTRSAVRSARSQLDEAKAERRPVWKERHDLEAIAGQHQQAIISAEGQMATYC